MRIIRLGKKQRVLFMDMDPLMMLEGLDLPDKFALAAVRTEEGSVEEHPAGIIICSYGEESLTMEWLYVLPQFRMQGIGERLLLEAFEIARKGNLNKVYAYFNREYGRESFCHGEEGYFRERLFTKEKKLFGEWNTDLGLLAQQDYFKQWPQKSFPATPLCKLSGRKVRQGLAYMEERQTGEMLYSVAERGYLLDQDTSFFLFLEEKCLGGLLIHAVTTESYRRNGEVLQKKDKSILYPVAFYAETEQVQQSLIFSFMQAAFKKYSLDTDLRIILRSDTYRGLLEELLPGQKTENKVLFAHLDDYLEERKKWEEYQKHERRWKAIEREVES